MWEKKGDVIRSYLEVGTALLSTNELPRRTLDRQMGGQRDGQMKKVTWSQSPLLP